MQEAEVEAADEEARSRVIISWDWIQGLRRPPCPFCYPTKTFVDKRKLKRHLLQTHKEDLVQYKLELNTIIHNSRSLLVLSKLKLSFGHYYFTKKSELSSFLQSLGFTLINDYCSVLPSPSKSLSVNYSLPIPSDSSPSPTSLPAEPFHSDSTFLPLSPSPPPFDPAQPTTCPSPSTSPFNDAISPVVVLAPAPTRIDNIVKFLNVLEVPEKLVSKCTAIVSFLVKHKNVPLTVKIFLDTSRFRSFFNSPSTCRKYSKIFADIFETNNLFDLHDIYMRMFRNLRKNVGTGFGTSMKPTSVLNMESLASKVMYCFLNLERELDYCDQLKVYRTKLSPDFVLLVSWLACKCAEEIGHSNSKSLTCSRNSYLASFIYNKRSVYISSDIVSLLDRFLKIRLCISDNCKSLFVNSKGGPLDTALCANNIKRFLK